ncbi:MAG TPA: 2'-5' RNA ligase family protein [Bryobacteraceae bacterium]|nr:2'-5' RNA ligase family protein [Bryobacteraceae bacterium]
MDDNCGQRAAINSYSLVAYLPEPLAGFVGQLRQELVPDCQARAHITILPPRALACPPDVALGQIRRALYGFQAFTVEFGEVRFFPQTNVVYLSILRGLKELDQLHQALNCGPAGCDETYPYEPHLTLAQQIDPGAMAPAGELVSRRWQEFPHARSFVVESLTFVQNTSDNVWIDLAEIPLSVPVGV